MIEVLLVELEGVLADTRALRRDALRESLAAEGIRLSDAVLDEASAGYGARLAAERALSLAGTTLDPVALDLVALRADREFEVRASHGVSLQPGARELLEQAAGGTHPARVALVTRAPRRVADALLQLGALEPYVSCVVSAEDVSEEKPAPAAHQRALARIERLGARRGVDRAACVALEDGAPGIAAARAAGVRCLAVGGVPAHVAVAADGYLATLVGVTLQAIDALSRDPAGGERIG